MVRCPFLDIHSSVFILLFEEWAERSDHHTGSDNGPLTEAVTSKISSIFFPLQSLHR